MERHRQSALPRQKKEIRTLTIKSTIGGNLRLRTASPLTLADGTALKTAEGKNPNALTSIYEITTPIVKDSSKLVMPQLEETLLYDLPTEAGKVYSFVIEEMRK